MKFSNRGLATATAVCWLVGLAAPLGASASPVFSEVFYDAIGSDEGLSFVELYAEPGTDLAGLVVEGINGADGKIAGSITLSGIVPADGLFVIGDDAGNGTTQVAGADAIGNFDFQNGPDSVVLRSATEILDALGYGVFGPGEFFAGEGNPAQDVPAGSSLARVFANVDTDDNALDFAGGVPTPGSAVLAGVPEPNSVGLLVSGLWALAWQGRWRAARPRRARG